MQSNELKWKDVTDRKILIEVAYTNAKGEISKQQFGVSGGEAAENEYNLWNYSGHDGSFTGWLVPVVKAGGVSACGTRRGRRVSITSQA